MLKRQYEATLEAFETMTPSRFRGWLVARIQECQDKIDGKPSADQGLVDLLAKVGYELAAE